MSVTTYVVGFFLFLAELLTPPNFRESSRAATVKEWLPVSQSLCTYRFLQRDARSPVAAVMSISAISSPALPYGW